MFVCQGLFRIAAGASKLKKLKAALDCSTSQLEEFYSDPHAVAGTSLYDSVHLSLMSVYLAQRSIKLDYYRESACCLICAFRSAQVLPEGTA